MPSNFYHLSHLCHSAAFLVHPSSSSLTQTTALLFSFATLFPTCCARDPSKMKSAPYHLSSYRALTAAQYQQGKTYMLLGVQFTLAAALTTSSAAQSSDLSHCGSSCYHARTKWRALVCAELETPTHLTSLRLDITLSLKPFLTTILLQYNCLFPPLHFCLH